MNSLGELTNSDGNWLQGGLTFSGNTFYGTAMFGGISGYGTVFKLNTDGTGFMILHSFTAIHTNSLGWATNSDGMYPQGGLIISGNTLYGTTECGGSSGNGVAYAIHTDGTSFTNLHNFNSSDGDAPQGGLNISGNTLYGTTVYGGSSGFGSIFKLNSDGTGFMTLHSFTTFHNNSLGWATNSDGMYPQGGLITSGNTLYGTTEYGGSSGFGTLFAIRTDGTGFRNLHSCNSSNDVGVDVEILSGNTLYGTTLGYGYADLGSLSNNGTVFAVNTDGTGFTTLYSFTATSGPYWSTNSDGGNPSAGLVLSGNTLYGTAMYGGYSGYGTVFALSLLPSAPIITMQPQSQTAQSGNNVAFSVVASGWPSPNYQWQFNGQNIAAQTAASLSLTNVQFANAGGYSVVVTNTYGSVTSSLASLVIQGDPANWNPSFVSVTPQSAPADGQPHVTATVTLLDKNYNSLVGKTVQFYAQGSTDPIPTPAHPTDNNGQTTTTITAVTPGKVTIGAIDVSDSFPVPNSATLQFTTGSVVPGTALSGAITQLANSSANILNNDLGSYAITEGQDGDYFKATLSSDERANGVNALFTGIGLLTGFLGPEDDLIKQTGMQVAASEGISLGLDVGSIKTSDALDAIANSDTGLTVYGQNIANNNSHYQQSELLKEQQLLNGVPPSADNFSSAYVGDIGLRIKANQDLDAIVLAQKNLILNLRLQSEQAHIDMLSKIFIPVNMVATLGESVPFVGQLAGASLTLAESFDSYAFNQPNLSFGNFAANTANTAMLDCSYYSRLVDGNVKSAFGEIAVAKQPNPITGKISSVNSVRMYVPVSGALGVVGTVVGWFNGQTYVTTTGARSDVNIQNNNQQTATFGVNAVYWVTTSINDQLGDVLVPITIPYVASTSVTIPANQSAQVALNYFKNGNEAAPDVNQPITIYLLGYDSNNGIYEADFATSYAQWQLDTGMASAGKPHPLGGPSPKGGSGTTNLFAMEYPINCYVVPNPSNQTYQAHIVVANPFAIPLRAVVTQPLPSGVSVLSTTGLLSGASIVWTNTIATNGLVDDTFTFALPVLPGMQTNLPAPTLVFSDSTGTNSWTIQAAAPALTGLFPIQVAGSIPQGTFGVDTPMQFTVTNLVAAAESGYLTVSVADLNGNAVTNFSATFSVNGVAGTNLNFTLPGNLPVGQYFVTGTLNMNGGAGQMLSGVYVVPPIPLMLHAGVPAFPTTNGMNLSLQGPVGSNYLVEASADLVNWTPLIYFTSTNEISYFTDTTATNSSARYYRAEMVSFATIPPLLQAQISGGNLIVSWPASATGYGLETSTNLADTNSWTAVANTPATVNQQSVVTNQISGAARFYRLKQQ